MDTLLDSKLLVVGLWQNRDVWVFISIIFLLLIAFSRIVFPKVFLATYSVTRFFSIRLKDDFGTGLRLLSTEYLHFTYLLSSAIAFNLLLLNDQFEEHVFLPFWLKPEGVLEVLLVWMGLSVVLILMFLLRYAMVSGFGKLFNLPNGLTRHFQEAQSLNQVFVLFVTVLIILVLYSGFYFPLKIANALLVLCVLYVIYRQINLYIKFLSTGTYSKLYIFSYLCTTEIIPVFIGVKLVL